MCGEVYGRRHPNAAAQVLSVAMILALHHVPLTPKENACCICSCPTATVHAQTSSESILTTTVHCVIPEQMLIQQVSSKEVHKQQDGQHHHGSACNDGN